MGDTNSNDGIFSDVAGMGYPARLLRNDQDSTKHVCLFYLAGIIGTGAELEDFFYLLCKTLDYDKNTVLFYYSTYMVITGGKLFSEMPPGLTDAGYESWVASRKQRCTSTRTSTCANLCKRKAYQNFDIPSYACQMCKLSPTYRNSRDPLERMVLRYFLETSTPASHIYISNSIDGFVSVERLSPNLYTFGKYPVIRFYNFVYDFLFSDPAACALRSDRTKFDDAVTTYICDHLDLSTFPSDLVARPILVSKLHALLDVLWDADISDMQTTDDGTCFADTCIRCLSQAYMPIYEGKQMNPYPVTKTSRSTTTKRRKKHVVDSNQPTDPDLFDLFDARMNAGGQPSDLHADHADHASAVDTDTDQTHLVMSESDAKNAETLEMSTSACDTSTYCEPNLDSSHTDIIEDHPDTPNLTVNEVDYEDNVNDEEDDDLPDSLRSSTDLPSLIDVAHFNDSDYVPFSHKNADTSQITGDTSCLQVDQSPTLQRADETFLYLHDEFDSLRFPARSVRENLAVGPLSDCRLTYIGQLLPNVSVPYRYCIAVPNVCLGTTSDYDIIRITDENNLDFLHACAASRYALLSPAVAQGVEEGMLIYLPYTKKRYFYNLAVRGSDGLDAILLTPTLQLYTTDTLGCIHMLVKYDSKIAYGNLAGIDLHFLFSHSKRSRSDVYADARFADGDRRADSMPLSAFRLFVSSVANGGAYDAYFSAITRLQTSYRVLFHQWYLPPVLANSMPISALSDDLTVAFLFRNDYRFSRCGTLYTILFQNQVVIGGDLSTNAILPDILGLFDLMTHRYYHAARLVYCDSASISIFLESTSKDAAAFYDMFYHGLESCMGMHGYSITDTVTVRLEYQ